MLIIILSLYNNSIIILFIFPLAISLLLSSWIRLYIIYNKSKYEILNTIATIIIQLIYKIIQPLLIILNAYGTINYKWADIFIPMWLLTFFGVAISIILTTCKPLIHTDRSIHVRDQALKLLNLSIFQISAMSSCTLIFLVWLSEKFDHIEYHDLSYFKILSPMMILYILLIMLDPIVLNASSSYQIYLDATLHQDYQQALLAARSKEAFFEAIPTNTYLLQVSYNTYTEIPYSLELESKILQKMQIPIVVYDVVDTIEMCVKAYAASRENSTQMLFSESAASIARVLSERRSNSVPVGQTYGADQVLYSESLSRSYSGDSYSDVEYAACNTEDNSKNSIVNQLGIEIEVNDVNECVICFQSAPDACTLDCGHVVMCFNCAVIVSKAVPNICAICRSSITKLVKITSPLITLHDNRTICVSQGYSVQNKLALAYIRMENETQRQRNITNENGGSNNSNTPLTQFDSLAINE
jgi:hypothetical protein